MQHGHLNILLVEDNHMDQELVSGLLMMAGYLPDQITKVNTLKGGIEHLQRNDVDIILLDLSLPDSKKLDGLNTIKESFPDVPIIVTTGYDDDELAIEALKNTAQDYLLKPQFNGRLLEKSIDFAVERNKLVLAHRKREAELESRISALEERVVSG